MTKKQKNTRRAASNTSRQQSAFGSGPLSRRFKLNKKAYLLIPVLIVGIGLYLSVTNNYFGLLSKSEDIEKGLVQATDTKESPASSAPVPVQNDQASEQPSSAADIEASVEGETTDPPVEDNKMAEEEESAVGRAAVVDTEMDNHEVEVLGGGN